MRGGRRGLGRRLMVIALATALFVPGLSATAAAPQPTITTSLAFAGDCSWVRVSIQWSDWRTNQVILSLENPSTGTNLVTPYVLDAGRDSGGFKASRSGGWSIYFDGSWAGVQMRGFGGAYNTRRSVGIIDRTDPITCTTT